MDQRAKIIGLDWPVHARSSGINGLACQRSLSAALVTQRISGRLSTVGRPKPPVAAAIASDRADADAFADRRRFFN